jgi:hypothetical protein
MKKKHQPIGNRTRLMVGSPSSVPTFIRKQGHRRVGSSTAAPPSRVNDLFTTAVSHAIDEILRARPT